MYRVGAYSTVYSPIEADVRELKELSEVTECLSLYPIVWLDVSSPTKDDIEELGTLFGFHQLALDDCLHTTQRPKVDNYGDYFFVIIKSAEYKDSVRINQVAIFVGKDYLVTVRDQGDNKIVDPIFEQIKMKSTTLMNNGTDYLCYLLIDSIVDAYLPIFDSIDDKIEGIESDIIEGTSDGAIKRITLLKKELLTLKKAIFPTMEMVVCIQRGGLPHMNKKTLVYFSDVYDHVVEVIDLLETSRELTSNAIEIYMSKLQNNINEVAKTFGMFAIILMWPTVIGAVYGMNFTGIPEFGWGVYGYLFSLALMAALMLVTWAYFRKKGWV